MKWDGAGYASLGIVAVLILYGGAILGPGVVYEIKKWWRKRNDKP